MCGLPLFHPHVTDFRTTEMCVLCAGAIQASGRVNLGLALDSETGRMRVNFRWCKILNISFLAIRYIKLYSEIISSMRPQGL